MAEERFIDSAIRKALGRQTPEPASSCPDENLLAAYLERSLTDHESSRLEGHVAECASCRELLALVIKSGAAGELPATGDAVSRERKLLFRFSVPLAAMAVIILGVGMGTLFLLTREFRKPARIEVAQQVSPKAVPASSGIQRARPEPPTVEVEPVKPAAPGLPPAQASRMRGGAEQMTPAKDKSIRAQEQPATAEYLRLPETEEKLSGADRIASNEAVNKPAVWKGESEPGGVTTQATREVLNGRAAGGAVGSAHPSPGPAEEAAVREAAPKAAPVALDSGAARTEAPGYAARQAIKNQRASLSMAAAPGAESRPREVIRRMAADEKAGKRRDSTARVIGIGGRIFELDGGFWVDLKCTGIPDAELIECRQGSPLFDEVRKSVPGLDELRRDGLPILLEWNGKICLIR